MENNFKETFCAPQSVPQQPAYRKEKSSFRMSRHLGTCIMLKASRNRKGMLLERIPVSDQMYAGVEHGVNRKLRVRGACV